MIELNQSWAGPYHAPGYTVSKLAPQDVKADPNADLYAVIPWAKDAGLELVKVQDGWKYMTHTHQYSSDWKWVEHVYRDGSRNLYINGFPTREAALKSPPPMPPGYVAANSLLDELAEVAYEADKIEGSGPWSTLSDKGRESWRKKALAVARRLLEREPSEREVSAVVRCKQDREVFRTVHADTREEIKASRRAQLAELEGEVPT